MDDTYRAAHHGVAFRERHEHGLLQVSGGDRLSWLNGLLSNDVGALAGGGSCYATWLTPQGRMITDLFVVETGEVTLLEVPASIADTLAARLDRLIFTEDARVTDVSADVAAVEILGPSSGQAFETARASGARLLAVRSTDTPVGGVVGYLARRELPGILEALAHAGASPLDDPTAEVLRVEAGVPRFLVDMSEETIPLEAGLDSAISHTKGCYVGQEIIVRIRDRAHGRVARHVVGLLIEGDAVPQPDQPVRHDGRAAGRLTSAVLSPALGRPIALAMIHRDAAVPGTRVSLEDGQGAEVVALPFVPRSS